MLENIRNKFSFMLVSNVILIFELNEQLWFTVSICIYILATIVEGDPNAPFSIATIQRCKEGHDSFS